MLTCTKILSLMVLLLFMVDFMIRVNMAIAMVEMTRKNGTQDRLDWDEEQKNEVLGTFFWGFLLSEIPGGRLAELYGSRRVLGVAFLCASVLTFLTPIACTLHYYSAIAVRVGMGITLGVVSPSIPSLAVRWIPLKNRSKFMSNMVGGTLGTAITFPISGYIIAYFGWRVVFYITGAITLIFTICWFYLVYDSPQQHPRISQAERLKIESEVSNKKCKKNIPWGKILTSKPTWAVIVAYSCISFNISLLVNETPTYMDQILHFNIKQNGLYSSLPYIATYLMAVLSCYVADRWIKNQTFSIITTRKIMVTIAFILPAILFTIQSFWGYNAIAAIVIFILSDTFIACGTAGYTCNAIDISHSFSGTILGLAGVFGALAGYLATKIVGLITKEHQTFQQWRYIFWILVWIDIFGCVFYLIFASGDQQNWDPKQDEEIKDEEKILKN